MKKLVIICLLVLSLAILLCACAKTVETTAAVTTAETTVQTQVETQEPPAPQGPTQELVNEAAEVFYEFNNPKNDNIVGADFTLPAKIVDYEGFDFEVTWVVENAQGLVTVEPSTDPTRVLVKVNKYAPEDVQFTMKGTVRGGDYTKDVAFNYIIKEFSIASWDFWATKENTKDVTMNIRGVIVAKYPYSEANKNTGLFIEDLDGVHGYFAYRIKCETLEAYETELAVGNVIVINGKTSLYNGFREMGAGCTYEVERDAAGNILTAEVVQVAIDDLVLNSANIDTALDPYQGVLATLTGFKVKSIDWNTNNAETYKEKGAGSVYVTVTKDGKDFKLYLSTSNQYTIDQLVEDYEKLGVGYTVNVTGPVAWYNGAQIYPVVGGIEVTSTEVDPTDKIATELKALSLPTSVTSETVVTLPGAGTEYSDVTLTWSVVEGETHAAITDGKLTLTPKDATTTVKVRVVGTCGNATADKVFEVTVVFGEPTYADIVAAAYALEAGKALEGTYRLFGKVVAVNTAWSAEYSNITVTIEVAGLADKPIQCFRLKGEGAQDLKVGDEITVEGKLKNYSGTIEFDAGCTLVGYGEVVDPAKIVKQAYRLGAGEVMENVRLTGVVTEVNTAWNSAYSNITVTIVVGDLTEYPIQCFRLKGAEGVDVSTLAAGDTVTVTGNIKNYVKDNVSTIEFDAGCVATEVVKASTEVKTPEQIVADAYALEAGATMPDITLTGVVTEVNTAWNSQYSNITVTIVVAGLTDKPIQCFRLKGAEGVDVSTLTAGDTVTVTGTIKNFVKDGVSTIEFDAGCVATEVVKAPEAKTPEQIVAEAYALEAGATMPDVTLTGVVTEVNTAWNSQYSNITVTIVVAGLTDKPIQCFRLKGASGVDVSTLAAGDTVTVTGTIKNFVKDNKSTIEFDAGCVATEVVKGSTPPQETTETTATETTVTETTVTETTVTETTVTETTVTETTATETTVTETTVTETTATETTTTETTTTETETTATTSGSGTTPSVGKMPGYEGVDFGGRTFYIATSLHDPDGQNNDYTDFWADGYTGDAINDAVYERNQALQKLYNCSLVVTEGADEFNADVATGGGKYIGYSTAYSVGSRASSSWYNVLKLDIDPTASYFDQAFIRDLACHGKLFSIAGSWSLNAKECTWILFYNKDVYESKFADIDIYQLVRDHKWTYDKMGEFISAIKQDVNGDSEYKFTEGSDADILGFITTTYNNYALYYGGGLRIVDKDSNGNMVSVINSNPSAIDILTAAKKLFDNEGYVRDGYTNARLAMQNKTTLFTGEIMDVLRRMKDVEDLRVGVVPQPLYNEEQTEYYHYVNTQAPFIGFTTTFDNLEQLSNFVTLFAYHSEQIVYPAFIDSYKYVYASDEESGEMVDLILNSLTYDPGYHFGFAQGWISAVDSMLQKGADKYASYVKKYDKEINSNIAKFEEKVDAVDDSY